MCYSKKLPCGGTIPIESGDATTHQQVHDAGQGAYEDEVRVLYKLTRPRPPRLPTFIMTLLSFVYMTDAVISQWVKYGMVKLRISAYSVQMSWAFKMALIIWPVWRVDPNLPNVIYELLSFPLAMLSFLVSIVCTGNTSDLPLRRLVYLVRMVVFCWDWSFPLIFSLTIFGSVACVTNMVENYHSLTWLTLAARLVLAFALACQAYVGWILTRALAGDIKRVMVTICCCLNRLPDPEAQQYLDTWNRFIGLKY